jgi:hypothetical protein
MTAAALKKAVKGMNKGPKKSLTPVEKGKLTKAANKTKAAAEAAKKLKAANAKSKRANTVFDAALDDEDEEDDQEADQEDGDDDEQIIPAKTGNRNRAAMMGTLSLSFSAARMQQPALLALAQTTAGLTALDTLAADWKMADTGLTDPQCARDRMRNLLAGRALDVGPSAPAVSSPATATTAAVMSVMSAEDKEKESLAIAVKSLCGTASAPAASQMLHDLTSSHFDTLTRDGVLAYANEFDNRLVFNLMKATPVGAVPSAFALVPANATPEVVLMFDAITRVYRQFLLRLTCFKLTGDMTSINKSLDRAAQRENYYLAITDDSTTRLAAMSFVTTKRFADARLAVTKATNESPAGGESPGTGRGKRGGKRPNNNGSHTANTSANNNNNNNNNRPGQKRQRDNDKDNAKPVDTPKVAVAKTETVKRT